MNVLVLGANGQLGRAVVDRLVRDGHHVSAFVRRPPPAPPDPKVDVVVGDAMSYGAVREAAAGQQAVVNVIGGGTLRANTVESDASKVVLRAVADAGVRRYIGMSAGMVASVGWLFDHVVRPLVFGSLTANTCRSRRSSGPPTSTGRSSVRPGSPTRPPRGTARRSTRARGAMPASAGRTWPPSSPRRW